MKKVSTLLLVLFVCLTSNAQGIYQLWGATQAGGGYDFGSIFSLNSKGENHQKLHAFSKSNIGAFPSDLTEYQGKFYGTTRQWGANDRGTIFEWNPIANELIKKYDFGGAVGDNPNPGLRLWNGKFYGTTQGTGTNNGGIIFEWNPVTNEYREKVRIEYNSSQGRLTKSTLLLLNNKFYGLALGGQSGHGTLFEWNPSTNIFTSKFEFNGINGSLGTQGGNLSIDNGKIYGVTHQGGNYNLGVIFEWDLVSNTYSKKIDFDNSFGRNPFSKLIRNGQKFYGLSSFPSTSPLGNAIDEGLFFEWDPATNLCVSRYQFSYPSGSQPVGGLLLHEGKFYGNAQWGGFDNHGVLYAWDPNSNIFEQKYVFTPASGRGDGSALTFLNGKFYATKSSLVNGIGMIYEYNPVGDHFSAKYDFNSSQGEAPRGSLGYYKGKFYGVTRQGGKSNSGLVYEWDIEAKTYNVKYDLVDRTVGSNPNGGFTLHNDKFYGLTSDGGIHEAGTIFEWDPNTNIYTKRFDFNNPTGWRPASDFTVYNGKFYGLTQYGGVNNRGVIYEWDPATNIFTKKFDMGVNTGYYLTNSMSLYNGKMYCLTAFSIFEWDPATNIFTTKVEFNTQKVSGSSGSLTLKDGKFYGIANYENVYDRGFVFEWDPVTNIFTNKRNLLPGQPRRIEGEMLRVGDKLYGMGDGGQFGGTIFELDTENNTFLVKKDFRRDEGSQGSGTLSYIPAPVARGVYGTCTGFSSFTIHNTNNNEWVPIVDEQGYAVAEIKANGNNLGVISVSMFINNADVREDNAKRLYLDRSLTITPQFQPNTPVDIRWYIRGSEYLALKDAIASTGQASGINSINDIAIFKNSDDNCIDGLSGQALPVPTLVSTWENDYVLSARINSFSSFYVASKSFAALPLNMLEFKAVLKSNDALLTWTTDHEINTSHFDIERSQDGINYTKIGNTEAANVPGIHQYNFTDQAIGSLNSPLIYYRLKQVDINDEFTYSKVISVSLDKNNSVSLYPNPIADKAILYMKSDRPDRLEISILDNLGRVVRQQQASIVASDNVITVDAGKIPGGMYYILIKGQNINKKLSFFKP